MPSRGLSTALTLAVGLFLGLVVALFLAHGTGTGAVAAPLAPMGTAFTYQGQLIKDGTPVNDTCDFRFLLYDAQTGGSPVGSYQDALSVTVTGGLFTVPDLDFGTGIFTGEARWLDVQVRCPANIGGYKTIGLPQALNPTPYALYAGRAGLANAAPWSGLIGVPAGFSDNVDNDTTYTTDWTLTLTGTQLSIAKTYQLPQGCADNEIARWYDPTEVWVCSHDITTVSAGAGLTGGGTGVGTNGVVTLTANFAGSGSASTVARSDHNHWGAAWTGSGTGLSLSGGSTGIHVDGTTADLDLGGSAGTIVADDNTGADIELRSNDEVEVHLDDDNNSGSSFTVFNGANTVVFSVDEDGKMTWGSWAARTGYLSVPAAAFHPQDSSYSFANLGTYLWPRDAAGGTYRAAVALPHGATVTKMTFYWNDTDGSNNATCTLYRATFGSISETAMATASSSGSAGGGSSADTSIDYAAIDNSQYAYYLTWSFPSNNFYGFGVVLEYTYTGPH